MGCTKKGTVDLFKETELKIMETNKRKRYNQKIGHELTLEDVIEKIEPSDKTNANTDIKGTSDEMQPII